MKKILEFDFAHKIPQLFPSAETFKEASVFRVLLPKDPSDLNTESILPSQYLLLSWPALRTLLSHLQHLPLVAEHCCKMTKGAS